MLFIAAHMWKVFAISVKTVIFEQQLLKITVSRSDVISNATRCENYDKK